MEELSNPAYQHVLINHLPIIGTAMGILALVTAFIIRKRAAFVPALIILTVAGASAWPVYETGSAAYNPIRRIADDAGIDWLDTHMERADQATWSFYAMAGLAALALVLPWKWPRSSVSLSILTALAAVACLFVAAWIAEAGGRVRHLEFRPPDETAPTSADLASAETQPYPARVDREMTINLTANMHRFMFSLDGRKYTEQPGPYCFQFRERLRLWMVNHTMMEHPMHLHGMWMQIENDHDHDSIPFKHTDLIKPGEKISMLITPIEKGDWAYHCHLLNHMEAGMFQVVRVA